jgi:hypothetical protein
MGAETAGRKIGIGLRLAARAAKERVDQAGSLPTTPSPSQASTRTAAKTQAAQNATKQAKSAARGFAQGSKRFGEAVWGPMAHTGSVLWLEITGLFFGLFTLFFAQNVYKFRSDWKTGPEHTHFIIYAALTLLFAGFTANQFYRARQKERRKRSSRSSR